MDMDIVSHSYLDLIVTREVYSGEGNRWPRIRIERHCRDSRCLYETSVSSPTPTWAASVTHRSFEGFNLLCFLVRKRTSQVEVFANAAFGRILDDANCNE